jgi:hypothetical protein
MRLFPLLFLSWACSGPATPEFKDEVPDVEDSAADGDTDTVDETGDSGDTATGPGETLALGEASAEGDARTLREHVVDWLQTHGDTQLEDERPGTFRTRHNGLRNAICWDKYLAKMRTDKPDKFGRVEWGDETTLMAFSCLFNLTVQVVCLDSTQIMMIIPRPTPWQTA